MYKNFFKRFFDIIISFIGILVLILPMIIFGVLVKLSSKGPVLFWQKRIGKDKKIFMMPKFRTMYIDTPSETATHLLTNPESHITKVGKVYRKLSIDELPQLFSILKGDMSIIGPRPALWNQFDLIEEREKYNANSLRPGLTGWAQINGRDELPIDIKAKFDGDYVKNLSLAFDIKCFFGTIKKVLTGKGVVEGKQENLIELD